LPTSLPPTLGTISTFAWLSFFYALDPWAALPLTPLLLLFTSWAHTLTLNTSTSILNPSSAHPSAASSTITSYSYSPNMIALSIHIISWLAQFVGHGAFEKRAPALLDNLVQAVFLAPFFVWLELLFWLGYRPELRKRVDGEVGREVERVKKEREGKSGMKIA